MNVCGAVFLRVIKEHMNESCPVFKLLILKITLLYHKVRV